MKKLAIPNELKNGDIVLMPVSNVPPHRGYQAKEILRGDPIYYNSAIVSMTWADGGACDVTEISGKKIVASPASVPKSILRVWVDSNEEDNDK